MKDIAAIDACLDYIIQHEEEDFLEYVELENQVSIDTHIYSAAYKAKHGHVAFNKYIRELKKERNIK